MVTSAIPASLRVSWDPPFEINHNGPITGHVIQYTRVGLSDMMSVNVTNGTTHIISGLFVLADYSVIVAAVNVNGTGSFSDAIMGRSGEDGKFLSYSYILHVLQLYVLMILYNRKVCNWWSENLPFYGGKFGELINQPRGC